MTSSKDNISYRIELASQCHDCDYIPKVSNAGRVKQYKGTRVQVMFNGLLVEADGYCGSWMTKLISKLNGHHEPQEEKVFFEILKKLPNNATMIELGSYWAYYSAWFNKEKKDGTVICLEPDSEYMKVGRKTMYLNNLKADFILGSIGHNTQEMTKFIQQSNNLEVIIPCYSVSDLFKKKNLKQIDLLHIDTQGQEEIVLKSLEKLILRKKIRFVIVSTHHHWISGIPLTHKNCIDIIEQLGGHIIAEHSVYESFSGDGLIAVSFFKEDKTLHVPISYARNWQTFFSEPECEISDLIFKKSELEQKIDNLTKLNHKKNLKFYLKQMLVFIFDRNDRMITAIKKFIQMNKKNQ